jgi:inward rectifier potassium channel
MAANDPPPKPQPLFDDRGRAQVERRGVKESFGQALGADVYHFLRTTTWTRLIAIMLGIYLGANLVFAAVLYFGNATIVNAAPGSFADRFWFSVQTMATIGYGGMAPGDTLGNVVVTIESFVGIVITAMATGLFFAKFATPVAKVMFSKRAVIADQDGTPTLMFRMANARETAIVEAAVKVAFLRDVTLKSGERVRRIDDLVLRRSTSPVFALSWTAYHAIDAASPLYGATPETLRAVNAMLSVTFTGIDDRLATTVHARTTYATDFILHDYKFVDILIEDAATGRRIIDFTHFDETVPVAPAPVTPSRADPA